MRKVLGAAATALVVGLALPGTAGAQSSPFPPQEIFVVVPWAPGGRTDTATRIWTPFLSKVLGVPVVVDNKPGGGGIVGARHLLRETHGNSVGVFSITHLISQWTRIPPFELDKYIPVALPFSSPFVLAVRADKGAKTLQEFVAAGKARRVSISNSGTGTSGHIAAAAFAAAAGAQVRHVPYEGDAGAIAALMSGEVDAVMAPMAGLAQHVSAGTIRPLAVSLEKPDALHKGVPTFVEQGVKFVMSDLGGGTYLPVGAPAERVGQWEGALRKAFADPDLQKKLRDFSIEVEFKGAEDFKKELTADNARLRDLVKELGLAPKQ